MAGKYTICAGTIGSGLWLSGDGGESWRRVMKGLWSESRVFGLTVCPHAPRTVFAGADDGIYKSNDGGQSFERLDSPMNQMDVWKIAIDPADPDIHDIGVIVNGGATVLTTTPREIFASHDRGESWSGLGVGNHFALPYCRSLAQKADDPDTLFVATGDSAVGTTGAIQRSTNGGKSWKMADLPVKPNSPIWAFATHPADPGLVVACSHYGELYKSENAGESWAKLPREFTEIRSLSWTPN